VCCCGLVETNKNLVLAFPLEKRINSELFIDGSAELQIQNGQPKLSRGKC